MLRSIALLAALASASAFAPMGGVLPKSTTRKSSFQQRRGGGADWPRGST